MDSIGRIYLEQFRGVNARQRPRVIASLRTQGGRTGPGDFYIFNPSVEVAARDDINRGFYTAFRDTWFQIAVSTYNNTPGNEQARLDMVDNNTWDDTVETMMCMGWYAFLCGDSIRFSQDPAAAA